MLYNLYGSNMVFMICKDAKSKTYFKEKFMDYPEDHNSDSYNQSHTIDMYFQTRICHTSIRVETKYTDRLESFLNSVTLKS